MKKSIIIVFLLISTLSVSYAQDISIIPLPSKVEMKDGVFNLTNSVKIVPASNTELHSYLQTQIGVLTGMKLAIEESGEKQNSAIKLILDSTLNIGKEGYELIISKGFCVIKGKTQNGLFYGIQSFLQLLPLKPVLQCEIPCLKISDSPRFPWRGMHLDVSRHFFPKEFILKYIDLIALHKMNVFHWHLVDDQGWRIEIKKYPRLTELGAWREDDTDKPWNYFVYPTNDKSKKLYGGFYTQSDIREIVKYAGERQITIVPEIEMPGHSAALIEAYPEISCLGKAWRRDEKLVWDFSNPVCPGNELTFEFLENILSEVIELFPSKYIHIGGDECKKTTWVKCPKCQNRMKSENLTHVEQLQSYLVQRIEKYLISKNRKLIGWDEILEGGLAPEATVMSWRGNEGGISAARLGHNVVMSPASHCYFDFQQTPETDKMNGFTTLEKVYSFESVPQELNAIEAKLILGGQANVWTELLNTSVEVEKMVLPRISALAEVLWSEKKQLNYNSFLIRLNNFYPRLQNLNYSFLIPGPSGMMKENLFFKKMILELKNTENIGLIYFTTDGSEPDLKSSIYKNPIEISKNMSVKAKTVLPSGFESSAITGNFKSTSLKSSEQIENIQPGLKYTYYEGSILNADSLENIKQIRTGTISKFEIPPLCSVFNFAVKYEGYIQIINPGIYTFYTTSDDGSMLYVSDNLIVDNNGTHGELERSGQIGLKSGFHKISAHYFQGNGGTIFSVSMKTPDGLKTEIQASFLKN